VTYPAISVTVGSDDSRTSDGDDRHGCNYASWQTCPARGDGTMCPNGFRQPDTGRKPRGPGQLCARTRAVTYRSGSQQEQGQARTVGKGKLSPGQTDLPQLGRSGRYQTSKSAMGWQKSGQKMRRQA